MAERENEELLTGNGEHILIVDDEPHLRDVAAQMLQSLGYSTSAVAFDELALEFLKRNRIDLIILDMLVGPGMSGRQTYQEIMKHYSGYKAILASGFSDSENVKITLELGARRFIKNHIHWSNWDVPLAMVYSVAHFLCAASMLIDSIA